MTMAQNDRMLTPDPGWFKDAVIYELHVKSFSDSDGDGIGDFQGLTEKLDYLQSLGVTALWLLPFYPSPFRDDGYDIADYFQIHPQYGTLADFKKFLREAHRRGLRVITELVLNHTSDQHPWFQRSRQSSASQYWRDFYVWSDTAEKFKDARIIFKDFESSNWAWDPEAKAYFWHRFYSHQPDLNFDNPNVTKSMLKVVDYWFGMGVDGLRLDAIPYLFEREGTNCENLPETYQFLEELRAHVDRNFPDRMLLAEANQWPDDAVAYFTGGKRCHMAFHFPLMPRLFMGTWMEDRFPIVDIIEQTPPIPESCQWALFLRNHDELTLEMVSDEERDYMYRVYAKDPHARINLGIRRRLAPLLGNNRRKIELMNMLLFSLPGTPIIYYGDELGMGDNHYLGDRNGVRTPMQWNAERNAGFSRANPQQLFLPVIIDPDYHYAALNVESMERNQSSLLWWMRRVIAMRKRFKSFGRGTTEFIASNNPKVLAFVREFEKERILVVMNLSRFSQAVEMDLSRFEGSTPEEVMSGNKFPPITANPYILTLGFYDYYWFSLTTELPTEVQMGEEPPAVFAVAGEWDAVLQGKPREHLEREALPRFLARSRWFGGKARQIKSARIIDTLTLRLDSERFSLLVLDVRYHEGSNEVYLLPLGFASGEEAAAVRQLPHSIVLPLKTEKDEGVLFDASASEHFRKSLLQLVAKKSEVRGHAGVLTGKPGKALRPGMLRSIEAERSQLLKAEQSNSSLVYGSSMLLKLYRKIEEGLNPDLEIGRYLTESQKFPNTPDVFGSLEYRRKGSDPLILGTLVQYVPNQGDAWSMTLDSVKGFVERVLAVRHEIKELPPLPSSILAASSSEPEEILQELIGGVYLESAAKIGRRTGEMHLALAHHTDDPAFAPEPFSLLYQKSLFHSMRTLTKRTLELLRRNLKRIPDIAREDAQRLLTMEPAIVEMFSGFMRHRLPVSKIRVHGDYHLGQLLFTGNDFMIIDFEGEPARSISERRLKRSPLRDVAGMIRSFHYPVYSVLFSSKTVSDEDIELLRPWAERWSAWTAGAFLREYRSTVQGASFMPEHEDLEFMITAYMLEKAIYEIAYELNNRPAWVSIPLQGIKSFMELPHATK